MDGNIAVIGSLNVDHVFFTNSIPRSGETLLARLYVSEWGGKGANQAVACSRLSNHQHAEHHVHGTHKSRQARIKVQMLGAVGKDDVGPKLVDSLARQGIDTSRIAVLAGQLTGTTAVIVEESQEAQNRILYCANANFSLPLELIALVPKLRPDLLVLQLEIPLCTTAAIVRAATEARPRIPVLLNAAPAYRLSDDIYSSITHLIVNETEAAVLTGSSLTELQNMDGLRRAVDWLINRGISNVIVTAGGRGSCFASAASGERGFGEAAKVEVVDTTAAGDTFVGAYAVDVVAQQLSGNGFSLSRSVEFGHRAAAKAVQRRGAQASIPWLWEV